MTTPVNPTPKTTPTKSRSLIPRDEIKLAFLAIQVAQNYLDADITLDWMPKNDFMTLTADYYEMVSATRHTKASRRPITQTLAQLAVEMDERVSFIKSAIAIKFGKSSARAYYHEFGLTFRDEMWAFPTKKISRLRSIENVIESYTLYGIQGAPCDVNYWQDMYTRYHDALAAASSSDSRRAVEVSDKSEMRNQIKMVLTAITHLLKAKYPRTYKTYLRSWGFKKG